MKIEISIEKNGENEKNDESMHEDLTPEQIAQMVSKLKNKAPMKRSDRLMLAKYLMQDKED
jgi:hypothetical protein